MSDLEKNVWLSFKDFVKNFLGNTHASSYTDIVQKLLESYKALVCNMNIKLHYLHCHLASFPKKVSSFTNICRLWKNVIRVDGMYIWWLTIVGASNTIVLKVNTPERAIKVNFYLNYLHRIVITVAISFVKT